jgi:adenylate cyclase
LYALIANGPNSTQRWQVQLRADTEYVIGRSPDADLSVDWDAHISRRHAMLRAGKDGAEIRRLPPASNPLFFGGREVDECHVRPGEHFVLGGTSFQLVDDRLALSPSASPGSQPLEEVTFDRHQLERVRFHDADRRIDVLSHLPEVIWGARTESELHLRLVNLILTGVPHAEAAAIVDLDGDRVRVHHWDRRRETAGAFQPSGRLVREAIHQRDRTVLHVWPSRDRQSDDYTAMAEFDWAFCTPVASSAREIWGIYVAGRLDRPFTGTIREGDDGLQLQADAKFTELVAEIISSVQRLSRLERQQSGLRQFFAPPVLAALGEDLNTDLLEPRECDVTVLFCDLRGFSQKAEVAAGDLIGLLERVSGALGVMTHHILGHRGVTGDFQGDAALGFWGWPFTSEEAPLDACRAALGIRAAFSATAKQPNHPLANFEMGIGIAHGRAVAGKIGTADYVKVTVFGPVVNLASRLEGMTKQLRVPILIDEAVARIVRERLDPPEGRVRRLARVLPYGMERPVTVSELLPPVSETPELTDALLAEYERGVDQFIAGRWEEAHRSLHAMPAGDRAQDFLRMLIAQHNRQAPPGWDGTVRLSNK